MQRQFKDVKDKLRLALESRWEAQKHIFKDFPTSENCSDFEVAFGWIGRHLILYLEIRDEEEQTTEIVTNSDLKFWNLKFDDLWGDALNNTPVPNFNGNPANGLYIYQAAQNDDCAGLAMLEARKWSGATPPIFLPTNPRQLTVFSQEAMDRNRLFELVHKEVIAFPPFLLKYEDQELINEETFSLDTKFGAWLAKEQFKYHQRICNEQRTIFVSKHMDFFVAPYEIHEDSDGHLFSAITIYEGLDTLWLPVVHQVKLRRADQRFDVAAREIDYSKSSLPDDNLITLSWDDFIFYFENRLEFVNYYPHRYKFSGFEKADLEPLADYVGEQFVCACRGVTAEVDGFGFPCVQENRLAKIPELRIRYVPTRVGYREIFDDNGKCLIMSDDLPSGSVGRNICVYLEYFEAQSNDYKIVSNMLIEKWKTSFDALTISVNDRAPNVRYTNALWTDTDIVWLTEGGSEHNITSLLKKPNFRINGDLVMWAINAKDIYAFGTNTDFMNTEIPKAITENSSFPPFPLLWDESKERFRDWLPARRSPMYAWIVGLQNQYLKLAYDEQYALDKVKPSSKTKCELHTAKDGCTFISTSLAADGDYFHFPQVDQIDIWDLSNGESSKKRVAQFSWDDFISLFGEHVSTKEGSYPILGVFHGRMQKDLLAKSALKKYNKNVIECVCCAAGLR